MKKSVLSIGAVLLMGGLGSAHAVYYFGAGSAFTHLVTGEVAADKLVQSAGGTGHMLYVPYYSVQGASASYINITNTDDQNGKAVKVRFRGAANSDDVLDFTLFLSPRDVWTARITKDKQGRATLSTEDKSCTLPAIPASGQPFSDLRLGGYLSASAKLSHTREGYVEILNMADIPPEVAGKESALYKAIKHNSAGKPGDCNASAVQEKLISVPTVAATAADVQAAGLYAPTGKLMGSWAITNTSKVAMYGGAMPAVQAIKESTGANGYGNIIFSPQVGSPTQHITVNHQTSDPLLTGNLVQTLWFDLPDMSTPLIAGFDSRPNAQVASIGILRNKVVNEYAADAANSVPMTTDWVFSQPTRRYYAALDYKASANDAKIVWTNEVRAGAAAATMVTNAPAVSNNAYAGLTKVTKDELGAFACLPVIVGTVDREERTASAGASFSPGNQASVCGEVFTLSFGGESVLGAELTNVPATSVGKEGWGYVTIGSAGSSISIPMVGFSATSVYAPNIGNFGLTLPYRW